MTNSSHTPAAPPRRTETVLFFTPADQDLLADAARELEAVIARAAVAPRTLGDPPPLDSAEVVAAREKYDEVQREVAGRAVVRVTVQALKSRTYRRLLAECPPAEGDEVDEQFGFDHRRMADLLLEHFDGETGERTIIEPDFGSKAALVSWLEEFNDGDFSQIYTAAVLVNRSQGAMSDPKGSRI